MKTIRELTFQDAEHILEYVFPNQTPLSNPKSYEKCVLGIDFEPVKLEDGYQVGWDGRFITGITYHNGQDKCILHFDDIKVISWLYKNGYDISSLLPDLQTYVEILEDCYSKFDQLYFEIFRMTKFETDDITIYKNGIKQIYEKFIN